MIDFSNLEQYQENNRLEAKKALGGLPESIWETYSAFANTFGGVILLGVEEYKDRSLHPVNLPDPNKMVAKFWDMVNDKKVVSANILSSKDVQILTVQGKQIIVITVPKASPEQGPVFVGQDPSNGTYMRDGDGDYKYERAEELP